MAENQDGQEKTEDPTSKKKSESRKEGQLPRSKEMSTFFGLLMSIIGLMLFAEDLIEVIIVIMRTNFSIEREVLFDPQQLILIFKPELSKMMFALIPFFLILVITGILSSALLGGFNFSTKAMGFKVSKLNPVKGLKKIMGKQGLIELIKSIIKIGLLGTIAVYFLWLARFELMGLSQELFPEAFAHALELISWQFLMVTLGMILVVLVDVPYQIWSNTEQLKMTKQEVKDESKNTEGNPEVKGRQKRIQLEMAMQRMMGDVPKADVIITNPTHFSVALQYEPESTGAPVLIAKGSDLVALKIRSVAQAHDIPILEIPTLSRAIYYAVEIGDEIPAGLYVAVAQILAYVFQLKNGDIDKNEKPDLSNLPIPPELRR